MTRRTMDGRGRRTVGETRELLLRAAVDLLRDRAQESGDHAVAAALAHVRFTQVAERATRLVRSGSGDSGTAAVTTGALYNVWSNQADFQIDLLLHLADRQAALVPGVADSIQRFRDAAARSVPLEDVVAGLADEVHDHYRADPLFRIELGFLIGAGDPRVRAALAHRRDTFSVRADQAWQALLDAYGLRLREPLRIRDLTDAAAACLIGATVLSYSSPRPPTEPAARGRGRSLPAQAVLAVVQACTEP